MHKKFMRKVLFLLVAVLIFSCGSFAFAEEDWEGDWEYSFGDFDYTINEDKTITITNYYTEETTECVIPAEINGMKVTHIGSEAFWWEDDLTSIIIPEGVVSIGDAAFEGCKSLTKIVLPKGLRTIGEMAFGSCDSLTEVIIPDGVTSIGSSVFHWCDSLTSITVPNSVTSIGEDAFGTNRVIYGDANSFVHEYAKENNLKFQCLSHSYGNDHICDDCGFMNKALLPPGIVDAGTCSGNATWTLSSEGVLTISGTGYMGYTDCDPASVKKIVINDGVTSIGGFQNWYNLVSVSIPDSVTTIGSKAFSGCSRLTSVELPNSVTSIEWLAFSDCGSLTSITIPDSVTTIEADAFWGCSSLTSITIPNSVTAIKDGMFQNCRNLTSVTIPDSVTSIGSGAFNGCRKLTSIYIPASVTSIGERYGNTYSVFDGCENLVIYGDVNSCAYEHAKEWDIAFRCLSHKNTVTETTKATASKDGKVVTKCKDCLSIVSEKTIYKASGVKLSYSEKVYTGKAMSPKVYIKDRKGNTISSKYYTLSKPSGRKNIGKYTYTIKFKGNYSGTKKLTLTIKPKAPTITTPVAAKKAVTVKWKKGSKSQVTGYEVRVATNSKFTKNKKTGTVTKYSTTSKKMTNLKAKTKYYVQVRAYKTVKINGKSTKIYSDWSKYKTCRTK